MRQRIIVFDVNETLLDVRALEPHFTRIFGDARALREWFSLLLLHSQTATLAGPYFDFATLGGAALEMTATALSRRTGGTFWERCGPVARRRSRPAGQGPLPIDAEPGHRCGGSQGGR